MFYVNEYEPVHLHRKSQGREARAEFIIINGVVNEINYTDVTGRPPLQPNEIRYFKEIVSNKSDEIVAKRIDFFVLHKSITSENITRRLK
jgi:hypothetical protein